LISHLLGEFKYYLHYIAPTKDLTRTTADLGPRRSLDLLLWTTRTRKDITLREYTGEEIAEFIRADTLDEEALQVAKRFLQATEQQARERRQRPSRQTKPA